MVGLSDMKVQAFECDSCGSLFKSHQKAAACNKKCTDLLNKNQELQAKKSEIQARSNIIRLNLQNINDLGQSITKFVKEHLDRDITFSYFRSNFTGSLLSSYGGSKIGWICDVKGRTNFNTNPYICKQSRVEVKYFADLFYSNNIISGIKVASGRSTDGRFDYRLNLYLQDFPKMLSLYNTYNTLKDKHTLYENQRANLITAATKNIIEGDKEVISVGATIKLLQSKVNEAEVHRERIKNKLFNSTKYKKEIIPDSKYDYDKDEYEKLSINFN